tara:strand:- start:218 stop:481 length:264 start_codon:yes stop_codon:yes gene_type:complete
MSLTSEIRKSELIGLSVKIIESENRFNKGKEGKVIDETRNMLMLKDNKGKIKKYIKEENTFEFSLKSRKIRVKGSLLTKRAEDRIKD